MVIKMIRIKLKSKKAQMKIQQMAFMLLAVTVFFIMAGLFIITIMFSGLRENAELLEERNALLLASKVADSSEFSCRSDFEIKGNCIDMDNPCLSQLEQQVVFLIYFYIGLNLEEDEKLEKVICLNLLIIL